MTAGPVDTVLSRQLGNAAFPPPQEGNPWGLVSLIAYGLGFILFGLADAKWYSSLTCHSQYLLSSNCKSNLIIFLISL